MTTSKPILVTGATGKTGVRIVARLRAAGRPVRIGSRRASPAFDWEDRSTWAEALDGVSAAYVAFQPDLAAPGALETVTAFFAQAVDSGVRRLVLLSGRGEVEAEQAEEALKASGADWTILRASWFSQNFSEADFLDAVLSGEVALPVGPIPEPFIDVEDIADVAFAALTEPGHSGRLYVLTGPRALTFEDATREIAAATGRDIRFVSVPAEVYRAALVELEQPPEVVDLVLYLLTTILDGRNTSTADGVQQALGRPAGDFSDYVRRTAATGVWGASDA
ncbi:NAD(P)H-binding protein [Caulobacter mirabilis]|uniref:NmrA family transcriptional regulator n=1 Tax=Caulobacter mirabilis TaxID=69666 RepID=A0A2D2ASL7_9CAUL|nr:NAD(P)H-binding protein [Caulobacter mirabilis]ATQ40973.1 NmrA family transcriptional regulator [Caulobacter mirabilis]